MLGPPVFPHLLVSWMCPTPTLEPNITYLGARLLLSSRAARVSTGPSKSRDCSLPGKETEDFADD